VKPLYKNCVYPITSFVTAFSKIFEKFMCKRLSDFLNNALAGEQFGFKKNLSMVVALFYFTDEVLDALNNKNTC
jgi:hypothetical protein